MALHLEPTHVIILCKRYGHRTKFQPMAPEPREENIGVTSFSGVLVRAFIAVMKHNDQKQPREERFCFSLQL